MNRTLKDSNLNLRDDGGLMSEETSAIKICILAQQRGLAAVRNTKKKTKGKKKKKWKEKERKEKERKIRKEKERKINGK